MSVALSITEQNQKTINQAIREVQSGHVNCTGTFTLTPSATTTTVQAPTCMTTSAVLFDAVTPDGANDKATTSIVPGQGQFVVTHANNARVDRTFMYAILG